MSCCVLCFVVASALCHVWCLFFFQAEDGIRDLVRSRGLGDVYKRQVDVTGGMRAKVGQALAMVERLPGLEIVVCSGMEAVSYTHLTLPTSDPV